MNSRHTFFEADKKIKLIDLSLQCVIKRTKIKLQRIVIKDKR